MELPIKGSCSCGQVRYELSREPRFMGNCHCRSCQRATGAAYLPVIGVYKSSLHVTGDIKKFTATGGSGKNIIRHYCNNCSSFIFGVPEALDNWVSMSASTLDEPSLYKPQMNIWTEDAQDWDLIDNTLPAFARSPNA